MNRWLIIIGGIVVVAALCAVFSSLFVLDPTQQAVVTRFGQITRIETRPGIYFKVPTDVIERVQLDRQAAAALRSQQHHAAGQGRSILQCRCVPDLQDHRSAPVPRTAVGQPRRRRTAHQHAVQLGAAQHLWPARIRRSAVQGTRCDDGRGADAARDADIAPSASRWSMCASSGPT